MADFLKRRWALGLQTGAATVIGLLLLACGASDTGEGGAGGAAQSESGDATAATDQSGSGGTLRIAMSAGNIPIPDQFPTEGGEGRRFVGVNVYDALVNWDTDQGDAPPGVVPGLAESWSRSEDNLTWTFKLRQGVTFHDGTAFDADAVMFAFDRLMKKDFEFYSETQRGSGASNIAAIASYEKIDAQTVAFTTNKPWSFFLYDLALINIPSPTAIRTYGNKEYPRHASGTGPFKIDKYVDGQVMELVPNTAYWGRVPKLERLILLPMPEPATRLAALQSGQVDWAEVPPPDAIEQLRASGYNVLLKSYPHAIYYGFNTYRAPFDDPKVRQAVAYGIDREGMVAIIQGAGGPATQLMYEGNPWRDPTFEGYSYDPDKARALLAEAGKSSGLKITVAYPTGGSGNMWPGPMNEKFQQDMRDIGIQVDLVPLEWNTVIALYRAGLASPDYSKYDAFYFSPNTQAPLLAFASYLTERIPPAGCCNATGWSSADADALFKQAANTFDDAARDQLLAQFEGLMMRDAPIAPVVHDLNLRVLSPKVRGWIQPQSWWGDFTSVWMKD
ncbi:MAG: ABC transporter substrate-binding protein [Dehalococcoidia bacterium]